MKIKDVLFPYTISVSSLLPAPASPPVQHHYRSFKAVMKFLKEHKEACLQWDTEVQETDTIFYEDKCCLMEHIYAMSGGQTLLRIEIRRQGVLQHITWKQVDVFG